MLHFNTSSTRLLSSFVHVTGDNANDRAVPNLLSNSLLQSDVIVQIQENASPDNIHPLPTDSGEGEGIAVARCPRCVGSLPKQWSTSQFPKVALPDFDKVYVEYYDKEEALLLYYSSGDFKLSKPTLVATHPHDLPTIHAHRATPTQSLPSSNRLICHGRAGGATSWTSSSS